MAGKIVRNLKDSPYVKLDKYPLEDKALSWKAKGMLAYLLGLPEDWQVNIADLSNRSTDGRDKTASGMNELIKAGYVVRQRVVGANGKFDGYDYVVFERPEFAVEWITVHGKSVNGFSVNGKSKNGKSATNKNTGLQINQRTNNTETKAKNEFSPDTADDAPEYRIEVFEPMKVETLRLGAEKGKTSNGARRDLGGDFAEMLEKEYGVKIVTVSSSEPIPDTLGKPKKTRRLDEPQPFPETADAFAHFSNPDKITALWKRWLAYKKDQHRERYKTADSEITQLRQLWKRAGGDAEKAEQIIEQSIGNLWKGLFDLKTENKNGAKPTSNRDTVARQLVEIYAAKRAAENQH